MNAELTQSIGNQIWREAERHPELHALTGRCGVTGKAKRGGHDSDDGVGLLIEFNRHAEDFRIAGVLVLPQVVGKNYNIARPEQRLSSAEGSTECRCHSQRATQRSRCSV